LKKIKNLFNIKRITSGAIMEELEQHLMKDLKTLLAKYDELYLDPIIRDNGDFLIPLHPDLKKNKEAQKRVADAFSEMMKADLSKKPKSKAWV
jgi:hypothetical protein